MNPAAEVLLETIKFPGGIFVVFDRMFQRSFRDSRPAGIDGIGPFPDNAGHSARRRDPHLSTNQKSNAPRAPTAWLTAGTPFENATRLLAVLTGFSIPVSTSLAEIATGLFVAAWLLSGNFTSKWGIIRRNAVAVLSLALFGLLLAGVTWSTETWLASVRCLLKYRELVYLPMFVVVFQERRLRNLAIDGYMLGACLLLGASYAELFTGIDYGESSWQDYVVAKDRIIHSLIMVFLTYLAAIRLVDIGKQPFAIPRRLQTRQWMYLGIVLLAVANTLFMVRGRTGYLLLGSLTALFLFQRLGRRGIVVASLLLGTTACGATLLSSVVRGRIEQTVVQLQNQFGAERKHSIDPRLEFYEHTIKMMIRHPLLGTGTGSFRSEYAREVTDTDDRATSDPHNEYLHLASMVGLAGPLLFVVLLIVQWRSARRLGTIEQFVGRGVVLTIALGSLFNSLILSVTGGLIYAYFSGLAFADLSQTSDTATNRTPETVPFSADLAESSGEATDGQRLAA